jgi:hypothetical protein
MYRRGRIMIHVPFLRGRTVAPASGSIRNGKDRPFPGRSIRRLSIALR